MSNYLTTRLARGKRYRRVRGPFSLVPTRRRSVLAGLSTEDEKKAKKKAKKAQQKQEEQKKGTNEPLSNNGCRSSLVAAAATSTNEDKGLDLAPQKDDDPDGTKLLSSPEPLERAWKLLSPLLQLSISNIDLWVTVYDVAVRRGGLNGPTYRLILNYHNPGKSLQAVRALNRAKVLSADDPELHVRLVHFRKQRLWSLHTIELLLTFIFRGVPPVLAPISNPDRSF